MAVAGSWLDFPSLLYFGAGLQRLRQAGALSVGARRAVSGPGALCVGTRRFVSSPGGPLPAFLSGRRSVSGHGALCVGARRFLSGVCVGARRSSPSALCVGASGPGAFCVGALFVSGPGALFVGARRFVHVGARHSLCRGPALLVPSTIGRCTPELGARTLGCGQGPDYTHTVMHERTRNETFTDVGRQPTKLKPTKDHPKNR